MARVNLYTTLGIGTPQCNCNCRNVNFMTRGASHIISYNFLDSGYYFEDVEQLTFLLKHYVKGRSYIEKFELVEYFKKCEETELIEGKEYFTCTPLNSLEHPYGKFDLEINPTQEQLLAGDYYERAILEDAKDVTVETPWQFNRKFTCTFDEGSNLAFIELVLTPQETIYFEPTDLDNEDDVVEFEVAIREDTDNLPNLSDFEKIHDHDAIFIEKQTPIKVIDSIYAQEIGGR